MTTIDEVKKLAALARIRVEDAELEKFTSEFDAILAYIETISMVEMPQGNALRRGLTKAKKPPLRNVMRADGESHAARAYTKKIAEQFPSFAKATEGKPASEAGMYLEVKQIISHD